MFDDYEDNRNKKNEQDNFITLYNKALNTNSELFLRSGNYYIKVFDFHKYLSFPTDFCYYKSDSTFHKIAINKYLSFPTDFFYYKSDSTFHKIAINKQVNIIIKKVKYISCFVAPYNLKDLIQIIFQRSTWELIEINNDDLLNGYNSIFLDQKVTSNIVSIELVDKNNINVIFNEKDKLISKNIKI